MSETRDHFSGFDAGDSNSDPRIKEMNKTLLIRRIQNATIKLAEISILLELIRESPVTEEDQQDDEELRRVWTKLEDGFETLFDCDLVGETWHRWSIPGGRLE